MPIVIIGCGLPGTGKTTFFKKIARKFPSFIHLENDAIRKFIFQIKPKENAWQGLNKGIYDLKHDADIYKIILNISKLNIAMGYNVIIDGCLPSELFQKVIKYSFDFKGYIVIFVYFIGSPETIKARIIKRAEDNKTSSDANIEVYEDMVKRFHAPDVSNEQTNLHFICIDIDAPKSERNAKKDIFKIINGEFFKQIEPLFMKPEDKKEPAVPKPDDDKCPKCGGKLGYNYGAEGEKVGEYCQNHLCNYKGGDA